MTALALLFALWRLFTAMVSAVVRAGSQPAVRSIAAALLSAVTVDRGHMSATASPALEIFSAAQDLRSTVPVPNVIRVVVPDAPRSPRTQPRQRIQRRPARSSAAELALLAELQRDVAAGRHTDAVRRHASHHRDYPHSSHAGVRERARVALHCRNGDLAGADRHARLHAATLERSGQTSAPGVCGPISGASLE